LKWKKKHQRSSLHPGGGRGMVFSFLATTFPWVSPKPGGEVNSYSIPQMIRLCIFNVFPIVLWQKVSIFIFLAISFALLNIYSSYMYYIKKKKWSFFEST
jgi:hypothetical protein